MRLVIFTKSGVYASMKRKKKRRGDFVYVSSDSYGPEAGLYKSLEKSVMNVAGITIIITNRDLPEDFIYQVTKAIYNNRKQLQELDKAYTYIDKENLTRGIPDGLFHPGALKFIKEVQGK